MSERKPVVEQVPCEICQKEIPASEAKVAEATDYVMYFCGLDCFEKWARQNEQEQRTKANSPRGPA